MVSMSAQANYGAILTSQKSPALSAVRQENKSQAWHQNPVGSQDLNIFNWRGVLHRGRNSRIKSSTPLRCSTKLHGFSLAYFPHPALRMHHSVPWAPWRPGFPSATLQDKHAFTQHFIPHKTVSKQTAGTLSESPAVTVPALGRNVLGTWQLCD